MVVRREGRRGRAQLTDKVDLALKRIHPPRVVLHRAGHLVDPRRERVLMVVAFKALLRESGGCRDPLAALLQAPSFSPQLPVEKVERVQKRVETQCIISQKLAPVLHPHFAPRQPTNSCCSQLQ